ncbi:MAG: hypothetical protein RMJ53_03330 [Chitinophagales bacterium]|nr:hypothetical protein [Chitinophagales bacterium]
MKNIGWHPNFLEKYRQILKKHAHIHLKTDDINLIRYSTESVTQAGGEILYYKEDIYATPLDVEELNIKTLFNYNILQQEEEEFSIHALFIISGM